MFVDVHNHKITENKNVLSVYSFLISKDKFCTKLFSAGIHPWFIDIENFSNQFDELIKLSKDNNFVGVGEIGLDKKFLKVDFKTQIEIFEKQLIFAQKIDVPVVVHCVAAYNEIIEFRKKYSRNVWIVHDFGASREIALKLIEMNIYLSLGKNFMRENSKISLILSDLDVNKIFFETDVHQFSIFDVYQKAAEIFNMELQTLENIVFQNFRNVFGEKVKI